MHATVADYNAAVREAEHGRDLLLDSRDAKPRSAAARIVAVRRDDRRGETATELVNERNPPDRKRALGRPTPPVVRQRRSGPLGAHGQPDVSAATRTVGTVPSAFAAFTTLIIASVFNRARARISWNFQTP